MNADELKTSINWVSTEIDGVNNLISVYRTAENLYRNALRTAIKRQEAIETYDQSKCDAEGIEF